jgi:hypothetical protein
VEIPAIDLEGTEFVYDGVKRTASAKAGNRSRPDRAASRRI